MPGFIKKTLDASQKIIDASQGSKYSSGFEYGRVPNMPGVSQGSDQNAS